MVTDILDRRTEPSGGSAKGSYRHTSRLKERRCRNAHSLEEALSMGVLADEGQYDRRPYLSQTMLSSNGVLVRR